jgi:dipeptidase E
VVVNAIDHYAPDARARRVEAECADLRALGFEPEELDLRACFDDPAGLEARLRSAGLVWVRGGNAFVLLRAARRSRLDRVLPRLLRDDALVYGGYSAAIALLSPDLHGVELVDPPGAVPAGYPDEAPWEALGVLPYVVAPHFRSDHPESADVERLVAHYVDHHRLFVALRDGEVIVQDGDEAVVLGLAGARALPAASAADV